MNILITIYRTDSRYDMMSRHPENIPGNKYRMIYGEFYSRYDIEHYTWCIFTRTAVVSYRYYTIPGIYNIPLAIYIYVYVCLSIFRTFGNFSLRTSTFRQNTKYSDTGSPAGLLGLGFGAIRALWSAWRALKSFFPGGSG